MSSKFCIDYPEIADLYYKFLYYFRKFVINLNCNCTRYKEKNETKVEPEIELKPQNDDYLDEFEILDIV